MFESALFGHMKGAFTGAIADVKGYLREADQGTLLLDEIGALPPSLQPKLLRVLETGTFRPVGAGRDFSSDFRIISATNDHVASRGEEGFRQDLLHRLRGLSIDLPPLSSRSDDVPLLVAHFLGKRLAAERHFEITADAMALLRAFDWPGNIRQLRHTIEAATIMSRGYKIDRRLIETLLGAESSVIMRRDQHSFARQRLQAIMEHAEWRTDLAAEIMGVHRSTVYRRLERLALAIDRDAVMFRERRDARRGKSDAFH
jgi:DNA-binding NtrC family response regulator